MSIFGDPGILYFFDRLCLSFPTPAVFTLVITIVLLLDKCKRKRSSKSPPPPARDVSPSQSSDHESKTKNPFTSGFKPCSTCNLKMSLTDRHSQCFTCLTEKHRMYQCDLCFAFSWKAYRARFLRQLLWGLGLLQDSNMAPPPSKFTPKMLVTSILKLITQEELDQYLLDASTTYKSFAPSASDVPADLSASVSLLEDSPDVDSSSEEEGSRATFSQTQSHTGKSVASAALTVGDSSSLPSQAQTGASSASITDPKTGFQPDPDDAKEKTTTNVEDLQESARITKGLVASSSERGGGSVFTSAQDGCPLGVSSGQSLIRFGGSRVVHSVANETSLATERLATSSAVSITALNQSLESIKRRQFTPSATSTGPSLRASSSTPFDASRHQADPLSLPAPMGELPARVGSSRGTSPSRVVEDILHRQYRGPSSLQAFNQPTRTDEPRSSEASRSTEDLRRRLPQNFGAPVTSSPKYRSTEVSVDMDAFFPPARDAKLTYPEVLRQVLRSLNLDHLLVEGPPPSTSPWSLQPEEPQGSHGASLALDDHILMEILNAFQVPEPKSRIVDHSSQFKVPPNIYNMFFRSPPLDQHVSAMLNPRGSTPNVAVSEHRRVVEGLYEAFMATWRTNWHSSVLIRYLQTLDMDDGAKAVVDALFKAVVEQRSTSLAGAASSVGLMRRQAIDASSLGNWTALRTRLAPVPFRGSHLFDGATLPTAEDVDKEEEQVKRAKSIASRKGPKPGPSFSSRGRISANFGGPTRQQPRQQPQRAQHQQQQQQTTHQSRSRSRSRGRPNKRNRSRGRSSSRPRVSFKGPHTTHH